MPLTWVSTEEARTVRIPPPPRALTRDRERRWRCADAFVTIQDVVGPGDGIADSDAGWLRSGPQFEIVWSVVISNSVSMMNGFTIHQISTK